jgi:hypothetical protein
MSPWTALLQSLHSALIDEINERLPKLKPELGMPIRQRELAAPAPEVQSTLICEASFLREDEAAAKSTAASATSRGFVLLSVDADAAKKLGLDTRKLWAVLLKRAAIKEFGHHKISPSFQDSGELKAPFSLPEDYAVPGRVVWIPFRLHPGVVYLGLGA